LRGGLTLLFVYLLESDIETDNNKKVTHF